LARLLCSLGWGARLVVIRHTPEAFGEGGMRDCPTEKLRGLRADSAYDATTRKDQKKRTTTTMTTTTLTKTEDSNCPHIAAD
jgi:hypothetical protein